MINTVWLTVNRLCNFRCPWCYAENTKYLKSDDMALGLAKELVDFSKTLGAKNVLLIGGEPTYYPHFFDLVTYINNAELRATLVTNGYRCKDMAFVEQLEKSGLNSIGFSIKAANKEQQRELTKVDVFDDIKQAIKNLATLKTIRVGYSTVVSKNTIGNMEEFAQMLADLDHTKYLRYSTCNPMFEEDGQVSQKYMPKPSDLVSAFVEKFTRINEILNGKVLIEQNLATCLWPRDFINKYQAKKQISFGCHLQSRKGLVFDKNGKVIPCNSLPLFPIGQYGVDFTNRMEFEKFWMSDELVKLYDKIYEYPSIKCQACNDYLECGGGCPLKWFAYNAKELIG